jgi:hypothetical protein
MHVPWMKFAVLIVVFPTIAAAEDKLIGLIDFYGYGSLDVKLRCSPA